jgi:hypothetical protein
MDIARKTIDSLDTKMQLQISATASATRATLADIDRGLKPLKSRRSFDTTLNFYHRIFSDLKMFDNTIYTLKIHI